MKMEDEVFPQNTRDSVLQPLQSHLALIADPISHPAQADPIPIDVACHALHGILVPGLAHELNNHLTAVVGYSQFALRMHEGDLCTEEIASIEKESRRAALLVRSILDLNRPASSRRMETLSIGDLLSGIERLAGTTLRKMDILLQIITGPPLPPVQGDPWKSLEGFIALLLGCSPLLPRQTLIQLQSIPENQATTLRMQIEAPSDQSVQDNESKHFAKPIKEEDSSWLFSLASRLLRDAGIQLHLSHWALNSGTVDFNWHTSYQHEETKKENAQANTPKALIAESADENVAELAAMLKEDGFQVYIVKDHESAASMASRENCQLLFINMGTRISTAASAFHKIRNEQPALADRVVFTAVEERIDECRRLAVALGRPFVTLPCGPGEIRRLVSPLQA